jgi:hypothetical protein
MARTDSDDRLAGRRAATVTPGPGGPVRPASLAGPPLARQPEEPDSGINPQAGTVTVTAARAENLMMVPARIPPKPAGESTCQLDRDRRHWPERPPAAAAALQRQHGDPGTAARRRRGPAGG